MSMDQFVQGHAGYSSASHIDDILLTLMRTFAQMQARVIGFVLAIN